MKILIKLSKIKLKYTWVAPNEGNGGITGSSCDGEGIGRHTSNAQEASQTTFVKVLGEREKRGGNNGEGKKELDKIGQKDPQKKNK